MAESNNRDHTHDHSIILRVHTTYICVQFFAHISFVVNHAFNVTPRSGNKIIHCKFFVQTGFLPEKVQLKLMSHLQQLFTLHSIGCGNDYSAYHSNYLHYILLDLVMITAHTTSVEPWVSEPE